jgi:hypothetical protein
MPTKNAPGFHWPTNCSSDCQSGSPSSAFMIGSDEAVEVTVCPTATPIFRVPKSKQRRVRAEEFRMSDLFEMV